MGATPARKIKGKTKNFYPKKKKKFYNQRWLCDLELSDNGAETTWEFSGDGGRDELQDALCEYGVTLLPDLRLQEAHGQQARITPRSTSRPSASRPRRASPTRLAPPPSTSRPRRASPTRSTPPPSATKKIQDEQRDYGNYNIVGIEESILPTVERETTLNSKFHASSGFQTLPRKLPSRKRDLKRYSEMFRDYTQTKNLKEGKVLHGELVRNLIDPDMHLYVSLINFYAKSGDLSSARKVFDQMPERDVVSWTSLISGFLPEGNGSESVRLFCEMRREGVKPNGFTLATVLKGCSMCLNLEFEKQLHAENLVSWNALLNGYAQEGEWQEVLRLFCSLSESEFRFSNYTLSTVLKSCANVGNLRVDQVLHSVAIKIGSEFDNYISSSLVDMYSKFRFPEDSMKVFKRIRSPDVVAWNVRPNQFTLASVISAAADLGDLLLCKSIHACVYKFGFDSETVVSNTLISMYMNFGSFNDGYKVFVSMDSRDVISWNGLLSGFHDNETSHEGPKIFRQMLIEGFKPNMYTFISILRSCSSLSNVSLGKQVHTHVVIENLSCDCYVGTTLIDMYSKCGCLNDVEVIFNRLTQKYEFAWTVMTAGYVQSDQGEKAFECLSQMLKEGVKPNEFTLASCVSGTSRIASLSNGRQLYCLAVKSGQFSDLFVASALADMYGKCGCIADSETLFEGMGSCDTVLWNTMICSYSQHGQGKNALQAFRRMLNGGTLPDAITFIGVLSACSHMGLVDEGRRYFESINNTYGIIPSIGQYACMIDILGRAGKFDEVKNFIEHMELTPNALIWETVLGACTIHGNIELAEKAANFLFEFEPKVASSYIMLSNIYVAKGMWSDVAKLRAFMSDRCIKKEPGCSWVEYNSSVSKEDFWQAESVKAEKRDEAKCTNFGRLMDTHGSMVLGASYKDPIASFKQFHKFSVDHPEFCSQGDCDPFRSIKGSWYLYTAGEDVEIQLRQQDVSWKGFLAGAHHLPRPSYYTPVYQPIDSITNILFSSGTTGDPKAIPWTHLSPMRTADSWAHADVQAGDDAVICILGTIPSLVKAWKSQTRGLCDLELSDNGAETTWELSGDGGGDELQDALCEHGVTPLRDLRLQEAHGQQARITPRSTSRPSASRPRRASPTRLAPPPSTSRPRRASPTRSTPPPSASRPRRASPARSTPPPSSSRPPMRFT
nr:pentatricopeptide repeat-containing protein At3g24000, mitochondrial-like [Ipomoea trifida]